MSSHQTPPTITPQQKRAIDPATSAWVSANAGSGKTKVLTDRLLMLLLYGTAPSHILALTFTKVAAAEMLDRLNKKLSKWVTMSEEDLQQELITIGIETPSQEILTRARHLFTHVLETRGGIKIQTIHSFCQTILKKFSVEAGVSPQYETLTDEEDQNLLQEALFYTFSTIKLPYNDLFEKSNPHYVEGAIKQILSYQMRLEKLHQKFPHDQDLIDFIFSIFQCDTQDTLENIQQKFIDQIPYDAFEEIIFHLQDVKNKKPLIVRTLLSSIVSYKDSLRGKSNSGKSNSGKNDSGENNLEEDNTNLLAFYQELFFTKNLEPKALSSLASDAFQKDFPLLTDVLISEQKRLEDFFDHKKNITLARITSSLNLIARQTYHHYQHLKDKKSCLTYNDLIIRTRNLLTQNNEAAAWVLYKIDGGIDHILIDEAQDTNFEQWDIIKSISQEFFSGESKYDDKAKLPRTLFVVGDAKQSIYSFQRSDPKAFIQLKSFFENKIQESQKRFDYIPLDESFRSAPAILKAVDLIFNDPYVQQKFPEKNLQHIPFHKTRKGKVALLPLVTPPSQTKEDAKDKTPNEEKAEEEQKASIILAQNLAQTIASWVGKRPLTGENRLVRAGDIMILLRKREEAFISTLNRSLKNLGIPTAGADRLNITDELAIKDLLSAASFVLSPYDDFTLACFLKSPFIGITEEHLYELATTRITSSQNKSISPNTTPSLWEHLSQQKDPQYQDVISYLHTLLQRQAWKPYDFFSYLLHQTGPLLKDVTGYQNLIRRLGSDVKDPVEAFLTYALAFGDQHGHTLQGFVPHILKNKPQIRRDMDVTDLQEVRTLTIHGAKGLQAPIVILPDAHASSIIKGGHKTPQVLWHQQEDCFVPLWCPYVNLFSHFYKKVTDDYKIKAEEEHKRLFYVAATRPQNELYITGIKTKQTLDPECWYNLTENVFKKHAHKEPFPFIDDQGEALVIKDEEEKQHANSISYLTEKRGEEKRGKEKRIGKEKKEEGEKTSPQKNNQTHQEEPNQTPENLEIPAFFQTPPASFYKNIAPSHPSTQDDVTPPSAVSSHSMTRGIIIHRLLEMLPQVPASKRLESAIHYVKNYTSYDILSGPDSFGSEQDIHNLCTRLIHIIESKPFCDIFSEQSRSEVPLSGSMTINHQHVPIQGRIDRLLITDHDVTIVDFKSKTKVPETPDRIPQTYLYQMTCYHTIVQNIFKNKHVTSAILWTEDPMLMTIPETLIQETREWMAQNSIDHHTSHTTS